MPHPQVEEEHVSYARERGHWYDVMEYGVHKYSVPHLKLPELNFLLF